jgi:peroxiredoxin Q/BCP
MLEIGDKAPDFTALDGAGDEISLGDLKGKKVVLYFYPKDNTSGCTREACDFRDNMARIARKKTVVLGVSPDSVASHERFGSKFDLPFTLLSDPTHEIAEAYGVWVQKSMYGRKYKGIERSTFLIDEKGRIAGIFRKVKVAGHVDEVIAALGAKG